MRATERGLVLLPVVITALLVGALVTLMRFEAVSDSQRLSASREREHVEHVLEAALTDATWRAERAACSAYSLPSTAFGADSYAATFAPTSGSPVTITATATLADGNIRRATRRAVAIHDATNRQLALQPDAQSGLDTYLDEGKEDRNFGADAKLSVQSNKKRALLAFDLGALPPGVRVVAAQLELFGASSQATSITVHGVVRGWAEGSCPAAGTGTTTASGGGTAALAAGSTKTSASTTTIAVSGGDGTCVTGVGATWDSYDGSANWQSKGGDFGANASASTTIGTSQGVYSIDIGPLVREWLAGERVNDGLIVIGSGTGIANFSSSDDATASHRPRLVITYRCECGHGC